MKRARRDPSPGLAFWEAFRRPASWLTALLFLSSAWMTAVNVLTAPLNPLNGQRLAWTLSLIFFLTGAVTLGLPGFMSLPSVERLKKTTAVLKVLAVGLLLFLLGRPGEGLTFRSIGQAAADLSNCPLRKETEFVTRRPGEVYVADNPLVHLLVEGRVTHNARDVFERNAGGFTVTQRHFDAHTPRGCRWILVDHLGAYKNIQSYRPDFSTSRRFKPQPGLVVLERRQQDRK